MKRQDALVSCILFTVLGLWMVHSHALPSPRAQKVGIGNGIRIEPSEAIVYPGDNVTFMCFHPNNVTSFDWLFSSEVRSYGIQQGKSFVDASTEAVLYYSKIVLYSVSRRMSGEIVCTTSDPDSKAIGFLIVNGVPNGQACHSSSDCRTDKATCQVGVCECPRNHVRLRIKEKGFDVCREMIFSLYDPCDYDEQCSQLVDPKSVCRSVCVCGPLSRDRRGKCITLNEISYSRSQEMYRVGLIAVTCIIIIIVAVSLWVTLKNSCRDTTSDQHHVTRITRLSIDVTNDKPPSYDDALVTHDMVSAPPNMKDALANCMTAKRLLRQVSAPAGQLIAELPKPINTPNTPL